MLIIFNSYSELFIELYIINLVMINGTLYYN